MQTAAYSSIAIQTEFSVLPIPRPPHCRRAVCSIYGMECVGINSFLVTSIVSPRQCRSVTLNASVTLPTAQRPLRCALLAPRIQRASDLATVPPALVKGIWQSSPSKPLSSPAYDEFRICHSPPFPFRQGQLPKGQPLPMPFGPSRREPWVRLRGSGPAPSNPARVQGRAYHRGTRVPHPGLYPGQTPGRRAPRATHPCTAVPVLTCARVGACPEQAHSLYWLRIHRFFLHYLNVSEESLPPF